MQKTTFILEYLKIEHTTTTGNTDSNNINVLDNVSVQANLNSMVPYINQILEALPATGKSCVFKKWTISKWNIRISNKCWYNTNCTTIFTY